MNQNHAQMLGRRFQDIAARTVAAAPGYAAWMSGRMTAARISLNPPPPSPSTDFTSPAFTVCRSGSGSNVHLSRYDGTFAALFFTPCKRWLIKPCNPLNPNYTYNHVCNPDRLRKFVSEAITQSQLQAVLPALES